MTTEPTLSDRLLEELTANGVKISSRRTAQLIIIKFLTESFDRGVIDERCSRNHKGTYLQPKFND
jgi:hypothetical protein